MSVTTYIEGFLPVFGVKKRFINNVNKCALCHCMPPKCWAESLSHKEQLNTVVVCVLGPLFFIYRRFSDRTVKSQFQLQFMLGLEMLTVRCQPQPSSSFFPSPLELLLYVKSF